MCGIVYVFTEIGKAIVYVCAVALPAIALWGLFFIVFYHAKFWLSCSFWYLGIGALAWLLLWWRSSEPRRTLSDLLLQTVTLFACLVTYVLVRRITARPPDARDMIFLISNVLLVVGVFGFAIRRRLRSTPRSNQTLQPTAGRCDDHI
ncbi:MAG TPA: hypothetical protein VGQ70_02450 [Candidatus Udaeobacter sp.]|jgi:hypothetical protein|nr:hypothetical protein [Candidatus Udaeobacter sp.]